MERKPGDLNWSINQPLCTSISITYLDNVDIKANAQAVMAQALKDFFVDRSTRKWAGAAWCGRSRSEIARDRGQNLALIRRRLTCGSFHSIIFDQDTVVCGVGVCCRADAVHLKRLAARGCIRCEGNEYDLTAGINEQTYLSRSMSYPLSPSDSHPCQAMARGLYPSSCQTRSWRPS